MLLQQKFIQLFVFLLLRHCYMFQGEGRKRFPGGHIFLSLNISYGEAVEIWIIEILI